MQDWCSFGHKFNDRCGHSSRKHDDQERSPIFLQWLDVVWQLMRQFPNAFEFTERLLVFLGDSLYSCQFGTFLGNSECERHGLALNARQATTSIWTYVLAQAHGARFRNPLYVMHDGPLWPCTSIKKLALWERYFCRWDPEMHPVGGEPWTDEWGTTSVGSVGEDAGQVTGHLSQRLIPLSPVTPHASPAAEALRGDEDEQEPQK